MDGHITQYGGTQMYVVDLKVCKFSLQNVLGRSSWHTHASSSL